MDRVYWRRSESKLVNWVCQRRSRSDHIDRSAGGVVGSEHMDWFYLRRRSRSEHMD